MYAQQYVENDLIDKSPVELIRLLYSKAIEKLGQGARHTQSGDVRGRNSCLARVMEIVAELQGALDLEAGGELALELARIYDYVQSRMIEAAGEPTAVAPLEEVRRLLENLCEGWNECDPPPMNEEVPDQRIGVKDDVLDDASQSTAKTAGSPERDAATEEESFDDDDLIPAAASEYGGHEGHVWTL